MGTDDLAKFITVNKDCDKVCRISVKLGLIGLEFV